MKNFWYRNSLNITSMIVCCFWQVSFSFSPGRPNNGVALWVLLLFFFPFHYFFFPWYVGFLYLFPLPPPRPYCNTHTWKPFYHFWQINTNKHELSNPKKQKLIAMRTSRIMVHSKCKDFLCNECSIFVILASLTITCARGKLQAFASPKLQTPRTMKLSLLRFAVVHACPASRPHS